MSGNDIARPFTKLEKRILKARDLARAGTIFAPPGFINANPERLFKICNGCGAQGSKFDFVPDTIYMTPVGEACMVHDWGYHNGHSIEDKEEADRVFLNNLLRLIDYRHKWYKPKYLMRARAYLYYTMVKRFGGPAYWKDKL